MKKFAYVLAALGAIAVAAPTIASAETVVIKRGHHHGWHGGDRGGPDGQGAPGMQDNGPDNDGGLAPVEPDKKG